MRTDGAATGADARCSRRALLRTGGAVAGAGVLGTGVAGASGESGGGDELRIAATEPYLAAARSLADDLGAAAGREGDGLDVAVVAAEPAANVLDGDADVLVSGTPVERGRGEPRPAAAVAASGVAALDAGGWHEPLGRSAVRGRWTAAEAVETWSEADPASAVAARGDATQASADDAAGADDLADRPRLVRGTRSAQYAHGSGGEAYYEVDGDALGPLPDDPDDLGDATAAVARLAFVHASSTLLEGERGAAALEQLAAATPSATAVGAEFVDPAVDE